MNFTQLYIMVAQSISKNDVDLINEDGGLTSDSFARGLQIAFGIAGGIAFIIVVYGGLKYVLSQGNPQETNKAKNTIIDAMIGLAVIVTAFGIVTFVVENLL